MIRRSVLAKKIKCTVASGLHKVAAENQASYKALNSCLLGDSAGVGDMSAADRAGTGTLGASRKLDDAQPW